MCIIICYKIKQGDEVMKIRKHLLMSYTIEDLKKN